MSLVDIRPVELDVVAAAQAVVAPPTLAQRRSRRSQRRWRWLAAMALVSPGGGLAYELLTRPEASNGAIPGSPEGRTTAHAVRTGAGCG